LQGSGALYKAKRGGVRSTMIQHESPNLPNAREFIQNWLTRRQLNAAQLSRITGLKQYTISRFLNGKVDEVDLATATRLYDACAPGLSDEERERVLHWLGLGTLWSAVRNEEAGWLTDAGEAEVVSGMDQAAAREMVEEWMRGRRVSQAELARRAEIDASRIGRFLKGKIEAKTAARIYHAVRESFDAAGRRRLLAALGLHEMAQVIMGQREE